jgi:glycosyltransferase involved in cell wall biosynthesis
MNLVRVLHVLGSMNRGGVETWLMHVLRRVDPAKVRMDFLVHSDREAAYDAEAKALGARIFSCSHHRNPLAYARRFRAIVKQFGPYDVVHSHVHHHSALALSLATRFGIPVRIAHSHNDTSIVEATAGLARKAYLASAKSLIRRNCTIGLAASMPAAADLFGPNWKNDARYRILHCGIDLRPFRQPIDRDSARAEFGFSPNDIVFAHVGRFDHQKNHDFLIELAAEVAKTEPRARFLLVGDGPLRSEIEQKVRVLGIADRVVFAGLRADVPRLLTGIADRFLFPSLHEGLPLALIEAQAANLPAVVSDATASGELPIQTLIRRVPLERPAKLWAEIALQHCGQFSGALGEMERSTFNIASSVQELLGAYRAHSSRESQS